MATNGKLTVLSLKAVGGGHKFEKRAAASWLRMVEAAKADGITLTLTDSYRPYAVQETIFRARYTTTCIAGRPSKLWQGKRWYQRPGTATAAVPGTSNHGWGLAADIAGVYYAVGGQRGAAAAWLAQHAGKFGWVRPAWAFEALFWEPWHFEYDASRDVKGRDVGKYLIVKPTGNSRTMAFYRTHAAKGTQITRRIKPGKRINVTLKWRNKVQTKKKDWGKASKVRKVKP
ncbi:M15 family metallopeptidase [Rarobacter faecitabidus]|uniref:D-alanyl-D-alanine carboxypeptidase-like protein n=1 Tax=Rarobacter faecitabidus TaxID=13243 RepID=A0A542ZE06_RARFA|nr:M15 family metallopeptidase [Rarobacter faecitabidus]TQL58519.1 D-alanyl-D-alanine carboxypeptidase-like protein [Rarobacter faecitabidus]